MGFAFGRAVLFLFWFPLFAFGEKWEPNVRLFPAAAGEKDMVVERPRTSYQMTERTRCDGQIAFSPAAERYFLSFGSQKTSFPRCRRRKLSVDASPHPPLNEQKPAVSHKCGFFCSNRIVLRNVGAHGRAPLRVHQDAAGTARIAKNLHVKGRRPPHPPLVGPLWRQSRHNGPTKKRQEGPECPNHPTGTGTNVTARQSESPMWCIASERDKAQLDKTNRNNLYFSPQIFAVSENLGRKKALLPHGHRRKRRCVGTTA